MGFRKYWEVKSLVLILALSLISAERVSAQSVEPAKKVVRGQYLVSSASLSKNKISAAKLLNSSARALGSEVVSDLGNGVRLLHRGAQAAHISSDVLLDVADEDQSDTFCTDLMKADPTIACSPDYVVSTSNTNPNDPRQGEVWGLNETQGSNGPGAWDVSQGSSSVVVAIIDTGIDYTHPDLQQNVWVNPGEIANNGIDDDNNGYIDDVNGINAITRTGNPFDDNGHGTHVAGTIGARGNNGVGVAGVNWNVKMMGLKFLDRNGSGSLSSAIVAINYMVMMKNRGVNIRVSNNSWGGGGFSQALYNAIAASRDAGIIFAAAAGNESNDNDASPSYPASYQLSNIISVAAVDSSRNLASFSNYGANSVDIAAPGVQIRSTYPGNRYELLSGTSMATPHVTGAVALLAAIEPSLTAAQIKTRILESGVPLAQLSGLVRTTRMLNLARMALNITSPIPAPTPTPTPCGFAMQEISYDPDLSADNETVVQQADEFSFYTVNLPFAFPFAGGSVSTIRLSPNGVIYTQAAPSSMDYSNSATAPLQSIAALQTDLVAEAAPYGVRVAINSDKVTVYWLAKHYAGKTAGDVKVRTTIHSDGTIDNFVSFSSAGLEDLVSARATIGVSGASANPANTYGYNNAKIRNGAAVRFTPSCNLNPTVSKVRVRGIDRGKERSLVQSRGKFRVKLQGYGTGSINVIPQFNGKSCPSQFNMSLVDGIASVQLRMPNVSQKVQKVEFVAGGTSGSAKVTNRNLRSRSVKKISAKELENYCSKLVNSIRQE